MKTKSIFILILTCILIASITTITFADVRVKGYYRKDGTYVQGHWRSNPDGNPYNNYSFPGNINPHTGKKATGNPSTYLKNYYKWKSTYKYYRSHYNNQEFSKWLKDMKSNNKQFAECLTQYKKEQEKLKQEQEREKLKKGVLLFLIGLTIGYISSIDY